MKYTLLLIGLIHMIACVPITNTPTVVSKSLIHDNVDYESKIGLVQLYPENTQAQATLEYPVIGIKSTGLNLSFDLLEEDAIYLNARMVHCNANWKPSMLTDLEFMNVYNEFNINQYNYSSNTRVPYVNYYSTLPTPSVSGNYLLIVYNENNKEDILFTRRFLVVDQKTTVNALIKQSSLVSKRTQNQQIEFSIDYKVLGNINPLREIKAIILQNHNWNSQLTELKPTLIRLDESYLEYHHFSGENNFPGGNEYRFFDLRSIDYPGMNISNVSKQTDKVQAFVNQDKLRGDLAYTELNQDLNGGYYLHNSDPNDTDLQSEYTEVFFDLFSEKINGDVYIIGRFNNWALNLTNKMGYNPESQSYRGKLWLKQGYYDYCYWVQSSTEPSTLIEGSFYQTVNDYEILIYYRNPFKNYDELVGYTLLSSGN